MCNTNILRLLFATAAISVAAFFREQGWGLFNYYDVSPAITIISCVVIMGFVIYLQHIMVHAVPILWREHRVHHW